MRSPSLQPYCGEKMTFGRSFCWELESPSLGSSPPAADAAKQRAKIAFAEQKLLGTRPPERIRPSEREAWLREHPWFNQVAGGMAENFPAVPSCPFHRDKSRKAVPRHSAIAGNSVLVLQLEIEIASAGIDKASSWRKGKG